MLQNLQGFMSRLADEYRTNEIDRRELEHRILELIALEIDESALDRATWLKAFSDAEADEPKAKALYIKYRKDRLLDQVATLEIQAKRNAKEERRTRQAAEASDPPRRRTYVAPSPEADERTEETNRRWVYSLTIVLAFLLSFITFSYFFGVW